MISVHIVLREKLSLALLRDGGVSNCELLGDLNVTVTDASAVNSSVTISHNETFSANELQFKTHPNVDKKLWGEGKVTLRGGKTFPVGNGVPVLKWRLNGKDESWVPISSELRFSSQTNEFLISKLSQLLAHGEWVLYGSID
jgi:coatomer subunit delta